MDLQPLYQLKTELINRGVKEDAADVFARMYPFFLQYAYGISVPQLATFLEKSVKQTRRYVRQLEEKNVLLRLHYRAWTMSEAVKELVDVTHH